jgi:hypothetical protein
MEVLYMAITYLFDTVVTMKDYNRDKWWIDSNIVKPLEIVADTIVDALKQYAAIVQDKACIDVSKTAIKNKSKMYRDYKTGETKQVGYVLTGSTLFDKNGSGWTKQFIDLWIEIKTLIDTDFMEV